MKVLRICLWVAVVVAVLLILRGHEHTRWLNALSG